MSIPRDPGRVDALLDLHRDAAALELVDAMLAGHPEDPALLGLRTRALLGTGDLEAALATGNRLIAVAPNDEWGHRLCALVLDRMPGRRLEALRAAQTAVRLDFDSWQTHHVLAIVAVDLPDRLRIAQEAAREAVRLGPNEPAAHFAVGLAAQRVRDRDTAVAAYRRTLALAPDHAEARYNLGLLEEPRSWQRRSRDAAAALRQAPHSDFYVDAARRALRRMVAETAWIVLPTCIVGLIVAVILAEGTDRPTAATLGVAAIGLVVSLGAAWWQSRRLPASLVALLRRDWAADRRAAAGDLLLVPGFPLALLVACVWPPWARAMQLSIVLVPLALVLLRRTHRDG